MEIEEKIENKQAKIGIIGLGYVGLPLAASFLKVGFPVVGVDKDSTKIKMLRDGKSYIGDVKSEDFYPYIKNGKFIVSADYNTLRESDAINICVPTPFTKNKEPDISYILDASKGIAKILTKGHIIILRSTTYPKTTEDVILPILERTGKKVGKDFYLSMAPERIDPGNKRFTTETTPVVVGGITKKCTKLAALLYKQIIKDVHTVSSPAVAEMTKLLENIFRSVNIALVNELAQLAERMGGIDIWEVIRAASTKPFGFMPFYPGPGIGGHCILIDPYYLSWKAREYDFHTSFIELAAEVNENMPYYVVNKLFEILHKEGIVAIKSNILILGVSFKRNVADIRNSPAIKVMEILKDKVKGIYYNDPYVDEINVKGDIYKSVELKEGLKNADCTVITTDHSSYNYEFVVKNSKIIFDTRNATFQINASNIYRLGAS